MFYICGEMLTYKRKLILNKAQQSRIDSWLGCARTVYNLCLEIRKEGWKNKQETIHKYELIKQLPPLRKEYDWIADVPAVALEDVVFRLDKSYQSFFNGNGFCKLSESSKATFSPCAGFIRSAISIPFAEK